MSTIIKRVFGVNVREAVEIANDPRFLSSVIPSGNLICTDEEASRLRPGRAPFLTRDRVIAPARAWPLPPGVTDWPIALTGAGGHVIGLARPWNEQVEGEPVRLLRVLSGS